MIVRRSDIPNVVAPRLSRRPRSSPLQLLLCSASLNMPATCSSCRRRTTRFAKPPVIVGAYQRWDCHRQSHHTPVFDSTDTNYPGHSNLDLQAQASGRS